MFYRLHQNKVDEAEFLNNARTWKWDFDDNGALVEAEVEGVYSACETPDDLLTFLDDNVDDDEPVAVFDGSVEHSALSGLQTDCDGEVWVAPSQLIRWITVAELHNLSAA